LRQAWDTYRVLLRGPALGYTGREGGRKKGREGGRKEGRNEL
jgi:hypothetical protein